MLNLYMSKKNIIIFIGLFLFSCGDDNVVNYNYIHGCFDSQACNYNPDANIDNNSCNYPEDYGWCNCEETLPTGCDETCGSILTLDECGECGGDNSTCIGCDGIPNSGLVLDDCSVCDGENSCLDECGVPNGDNSSCTDDCGVVNGDNSTCLDECGVPNGDNSSCTDDCGVVNGDNSTCLDECGVPNGDNSSCTGCLNLNAENYCNDCLIDCQNCCEYIYDVKLLVNSADGDGRQDCAIYQGTTDNVIFYWDTIMSQQIYIDEDLLEPGEYMVKTWFVAPGGTFSSELVFFEVIDYNIQITINGTSSPIVEEWVP
jgi:hypothetical protein